MYLENMQGVRGVISFTSKAPVCKNINTYEGRQLKLRMPPKRVHAQKQLSRRCFLLRISLKGTQANSNIVKRDSRSCQCHPGNTTGLAAMNDVTVEVSCGLHWGFRELMRWRNVMYGQIPCKGMLKRHCLKMRKWSLSFSGDPGCWDAKTYTKETSSHELELI